MNDIIYINRLTKLKEKEKVYGAKGLKLLYGDDLLSRLISPLFIPLLCRWSFFSDLYGFWQNSRFTKKKIKPFIKNFNVDETEFLDGVESFQSFNDFFIRRLKPSARPLDSNDNGAIIPADGRYLFYQNMEQVSGFVIKNQKFSLKTLLGSEELAEEYKEGSLVIARLCPSDYHRFHFPCDCTPSETQLINGKWFSVNPIAIKKDISIFTKNKRTICRLNTKIFGDILYIEVGATNVGSIHETYQPDQFQPKGAEKGYFSFGGSTLLLIFPKDSIRFDEDLLKATEEGLEMRCLFGQRLGIRN